MWACNQCTSDNDDGNERCQMCGSVRQANASTAMAESSSRWPCPACTFLNDESSSTCCMCSASRQQKKQRGKAKKKVAFSEPAGGNEEVKLTKAQRRRARRKRVQALKRREEMEQKKERKKEPREQGASVARVAAAQRARNEANERELAALRAEQAEKQRVMVAQRIAEQQAAQDSEMEALRARLHSQRANSSASVAASSSSPSFRSVAQYRREQEKRAARRQAALAASARRHRVPELTLSPIKKSRPAAATSTSKTIAGVDLLDALVKYRVGDAVPLRRVDHGVYVFGTRSVRVALAESRKDAVVLLASANTMRLGDYVKQFAPVEAAKVRALRTLPMVGVF
jgi:hypothetical protein